MEPRLIGRGKGKLTDWIRSSLSLQWSRDLLVAERRAKQRDDFGHLDASMEPRLIGRGKAAAEFDRNGIGPASMEPRLIGRGKHTSTQETHLAP